MQVILLERIGRLGQMGDVVKVRPGFARNFLLPQGKAMRATKENLGRFETERAQLEVNNLERKQEAQAVAKKLNGLSFVILRQAGDSGQLYGSVSTRDISDAVTAGGFTIDRVQVLLDRPIKTWASTMCASAFIPRSRSRLLSTSRARKKKRSVRPRARMSRRCATITAPNRPRWQPKLSSRAKRHSPSSRRGTVREDPSSRIHISLELHYLHGSLPKPRLRQRIP